MPKCPADGVVAAESFEPQALERAVACDAPVEVIAERTESTSVYVLPNGQRVGQAAVSPVWVRQGGDGTRAEDWAQVDLALEVDEDGVVRPRAHVVDLELSAGGSPGRDGSLELASIHDPDLGVTSSLAWKWALPAPRLEGRRAVYEQVEPGIDLVLEASTAGFRHYLVAEDADAARVAAEAPLIYSVDGAALEVREDGFPIP